MLTEYIQAALKYAKYEELPDGEGIFATIEAPGFQGVWANADTVEACEQELRSVLEDWILLGVYLHHQLPVVDTIDINVGQAVA